MAAVQNGNLLKMKNICVKFLIDGCLIGTVCRGEFGGLVCPLKARKEAGMTKLQDSKYARAECARQGSVQRGLL